MRVLRSRAVWAWQPQEGFSQDHRQLSLGQLSGPPRDGVQTPSGQWSWNPVFPASACVRPSASLDRV